MTLNVIRNKSLKYKSINLTNILRFNPLSGHEAHMHAQGLIKLLQKRD